MEIGAIVFTKNVISGEVYSRGKGTAVRAASATSRVFADAEVP